MFRSGELGYLDALVDVNNFKLSVAELDIWLCHMVGAVSINDSLCALMLRKVKRIGHIVFSSQLGSFLRGVVRFSEERELMLWCNGRLGCKE